MQKGCRRVPRSAYHGLTRGACRTALLLMLASWLGGCDANQVTSAITCSSGSYGSEVSWSLSCSDGTTLSAARPNGALEVYGAPPLSVVSSEQLRLQPTSAGCDPPEQVIAEVTWLALQPPSHDASISSSAVRQAPRVRPRRAARGR